MKWNLKYIHKKILFYLFLLFGSNLYSQEVFDSTLINAEEVIYFNSNVYQLSETNIQKLKAIIDNTEKLKNVHFFIDAHTDDIGSDSFNLKLSQQRGESVSNYLLENNFSKNSITLRFHGENKSLIKQNDLFNRKVNRKVVITVTYTQRFINLTGQIFDIETNENIQGSVNLQAFNFNSSAKTNKNGSYKIISPLNQTVEIEYSADNYFFEAKTIDLSKALELPTIYLEKAEVGNNMIIDDLNFIAGHNILLNSSLTSFNRLLKFMKNNENVCIKLKGHINERNSINGTFFDDLSVARALIIYEKLRMSGINENRMLAKGYSNKLKLYPNPKSEEEHKANRRVEIEIVDCNDISKNENDKLINAKYFQNIVENRKFNSETFPSDIKHFFLSSQSAIAVKIRDLKNKGETADDYTYAELLNEGENLKYKDNQLAITLRNIFDDDQSLRVQIKDIESIYGIHSIELKHHWDKIKRLDSINLEKVKNIIDNHGWLSSKEVSSKGNDALFLVIQHADLETQLEYLPLIRKAVNTGNAKIEDLALLEDRVAIRLGKKQIFGTQIHRDPITGKHFIAPIITPKFVNRRREEIGLGTIENYILNWNLNWETELQRLEEENNK